MLKVLLSKFNYVFVVGLFGQSCLVHYLDNHQMQWVEMPESQAYYMNAEVFKLLSFGQLNVAVDWMYMKVLQDTTLASSSALTRPAIFYYLNLITDLDPAFFDAYEVGSSLLAIARRDSLGATQLLKKSEPFIESKLPLYPKKFYDTFWRDYWRLYMLSGYLYLTDLEDLPASVHAFNQASAVEHAPHFLKQLTQKLQTIEGTYEIAFRVIDVLLRRTKSQELVQALEEKKFNLDIAFFMAKCNQSFRKLIPKCKQTYCFKQFLENNFGTYQDPWGGVLSLLPNGRIITSTPYTNVFLIEKHSYKD
jgi:hypothetical protein